MSKEAAQERGWTFYEDETPMRATLGPEPRVVRYGGSVDGLVEAIESWEGEHATRKPEARHPAINE